MDMTENRATGELAIAMAELARRGIGPMGTIVRVPEEDASLLRSAFLARMSEAAMTILENQEKA